MKAEYRQNQIQAKKEGSDATADEEEERPPGEDNPANDGKDSVMNLQFSLLHVLRFMYRMVDCQNQPTVNVLVIYHHRTDVTAMSIIFFFYIENYIHEPAPSAVLLFSMFH